MQGCLSVQDELSSHGESSWLSVTVLGSANGRDLPMSFGIGFSTISFYRNACLIGVGPEASLRRDNDL